MSDPTLPPEPGEVPDLDHGLPGDPEPEPEGTEADMTCEINDEEDEEDC